MQRLSSRRLHTGLAVASAAILVPCVAALGDAGAATADGAAAVAAAEPWFKMDRLPLFIMLVVVGIAIIVAIELARSGRAVKIRRMAALDAVDEAIGRATEMGRPVLFIPGIMDMTEIQTVAGVTILGRVAKTAAEYDAKLEVPTLIVNGDEDWPCLAPGLMLKRTIPSAALVVLPNCGHTMNLEMPDAFNREVESFLSWVEAGRWPRRDPRAMASGITGMVK